MSATESTGGGGGLVSMWALMATWVTPTVLFCFMNLMIASIFFSSKPKRQPQPQLGLHDSVPQPVQSPSLLHRLRSIKLPSLRRSESPDPFHPDPDYSSDRDSDLREIRSESEAPVEAPAKVPVKVPAKVPARVFTKSASEKTLIRRVEEEEEKEEVYRRLPETARAVMEKGDETAPFGDNEDEGGVDEKAGDFIDMFRKQLKLQRLDSLLRFRRGDSGSQNPDN